MKFTIVDDPIVHQKITDDLKKIINWFDENSIAVEALILVGGFGRGEGCFWRVGNRIQILNDYDIVIIADPKYQTGQLTIWGKALASLLGIRFVDLICYQRRELSSLPYSMFNYDFKNGGFVFKGEPNILKLIPAMDSAKMPLIEAEELMINRNAALLEAYSNQADYGIQFRDIQITKVIYACIDAILIMNNRYDHSYLKKAHLIREITGEPEVLLLADKACSFKIKAEIKVYQNMPNPTIKVAEFYFKTLLQLEVLILNKSNLTLEGIIKKKYDGLYPTAKRIANRLFFKSSKFNDRIALNKVIFYLNYYRKLWEPKIQRRVATEICTLLKEIPEFDLTDWQSVKTVVLEYWYNNIH